MFVEFIDWLWKSLVWWDFVVGSSVFFMEFLENSFTYNNSIGTKCIGTNTKISSCLDSRQLLVSLLVF